MLVTIFVGTHLIFREIDQKTILLILSKPISRGSFLLGKWLGLAIVLLLMQLGMLFFFIITVATTTDLLWDAGIFKMYFALDILVIAGFSLLGFWLLLAVVLFFASFMRPTLAAFSALAIFFLGHVTDDVKIFAENSSNASDNLIHFANAIYYGLPNFNILSQKNYILEGINLSATNLATAFSNSLLWIILLLILSTIFFKRREF